MAIKQEPKPEPQIDPILLLPASLPTPTSSTSTPTPAPTSSTSTPTPAPPPDPKKDSDKIKSLTSHKQATAWSIHRYPLEKFIIPDHIFQQGYKGNQRQGQGRGKTKTRIWFPRGYAGKGGVDVGFVRMGEDLNRVVWGWYDREVGGNEEKREKGEKKGEKGEGKWVGEDNFVAGDNICAKRHEFLGPDPRVAGYTFDYDGEVHIKWWDGFLKDQWIENQKWTFEFVRDANGDLVEKDG